MNDFKSNKKGEATMTNQGPHMDIVIERELKAATSACQPPAGLDDSIARRLAERQTATPAATPTAMRPRGFRLGRAIAVAAAACAVLAGLAWLIPPLSKPSTAYAEVMQALAVSQEAECTHFHEKDGRECWVSFKPLRWIEKNKDGSVQSLDVSSEQGVSYSPSAKTVTIMTVSPSTLVSSPAGDAARSANMLEFLAKRLQTEKAMGAEVTKGAERIAGKEMTVFTEKLNGVENGQGTRRFIVDPATSRLVRIEETVGDKTVGVDFDYPDKMPADVYALGVPREAKVIDLRLTADTACLLKSVRAAADRFSKTYHAIESDIQTSFSGEAPQKLGWVNEWWVKGAMIRSNSYDVPLPRDLGEKDWQKQLAELAKPFLTGNVADLEAWMKQRKPTSIGVIRDGADSVAYLSREDGKLVKRTSRRTPGGPIQAFWQLESPIETSTPRMGGQEKGPWGDLVGIVSNTPSPFTGPGPKCETRWYFNPDRDYLCERFSVANFDPNHPGKDARYFRKVAEYAKTPGGLWYPARSEAESKRLSGKTARSITCFVDDKAKIDDKLFDLGTVTADSLQLTAPASRLTSRKAD